MKPGHPFVSTGHTIFYYQNKNQCKN